MIIDKGVPMPSNANSAVVYPFSDMDVGDSVWFTQGQGARAANAAHVTGKRKGMSFISRRTDGGVRIWRTK